MDKQKQINEIADIIFEALNNNGRIANGEGVDIISVAIYNAGYRKIPENAVVLSREEYDDMFTFKTVGSAGKHCGFYNILDTVRKVERKETAEKFAERLKEKLEENSPIAGYDLEDLEFDGDTIQECIDEICKEITEVGIK